MTSWRPGRKLPRSLEDLLRETVDAAELDYPHRNEVANELRAHFEDGLAAGVTAGELADRFGDPVLAGRRIAKAHKRVRKNSRATDGRWWMAPSEWWDEVRKAARAIKRAPGFAAVVVLTLALGVGANTAIFTVLDAVLLEELPYAEPERLVRVYESKETEPTSLQFLRAPLASEYRSWEDVFEGLGAIYTYREVGADLTDGDQAQRVTVARVSPGYFEVLGIAPARGRGFLEEESYGPGEATSTTIPGALVAVLAHHLWMGHFEGDPDIVGRTVHLDGAPFEVVGVMPRGFNNPFGIKADLWVPQDMRFGGSNSFSNFYLSAIGRLRDGVTLEAAQDRVEVLSRRFGETEPQVEGDFPRLVPLHTDVVGSTRKAMIWILAGAAGLVLLTACVNVANLLFARGLARDRDLALRSALGSGRGRLVAGILMENGLLAVAGGVAGLGLGWLGVKMLLSFAPDALPMVADIEIGTRVFFFALAVTVGALLLFGLTPAIRLSRTSPAEVLRSGDRSATVGRVVRRVRDALVVVQVAAALMLVAGAALLTRSLQTLLDVPLGLEAEGVLTYEVHLPGSRYPDGPARHAFHEQFQARVAALPSVEAVGATSWLPVSGRYHIWGFDWAPEGSNDEVWYPTDVRVIAGDYFGSMGIDLLAGVGPLEVDFESEPVAWLNRTLADQVFAGDALGQQIELAGGSRRVVGIVEDIPFSARGETSPKSYVPHAQYSNNRNWALIQTVRAKGDLAALRETIREELRGLDAQLVLYRPQSFDDVLAAVRAQDRFGTMLMGAFAGLAVVLSLVGTYGVLAGNVAGRTREFGIRMALGADGPRVRRMVLRYAVALTVPGVFLGLLGAWAGSRWIQALLFEVEAGDPLTFALVVLVFLVVGLASALLPAMRATRVDTMRTLTAE